MDYTILDTKGWKG